MAEAIPQSVDELTPEWLSDALRDVLGEARVQAVTVEMLGEGEGFVGTLARLRLELDREAPDAPASVIAKLPTSVPANRATGELLGAYEREVCFYRELASRVRYRTPALYVALMDEDKASEHGAAVIRFIDGLPRWAMRLLLVFFEWVARRRSSRRYLLLIEDVAPAVTGDQLVGRPPEQCAPILASIADAQAFHWQSELLTRYHWVSPLDLGLRIAHEMFHRSRPVFEERFAATLADADREVLDWLSLRAPALQSALHREAPAALVHGDFRLDNLLFDEEPAPRVVDWQAIGRGPAPYDVSYFLSGTLLPDVTGEEEMALVVGYHEALVARGVNGYEAQDCLRDYRRSMLAVLHRMVTIDRVDLGTGRGILLFDLWVERIFARIAHIDRDALIQDRLAAPRAGA